jgi:hemoglobin
MNRLLHPFLLVAVVSGLPPLLHAAGQAADPLSRKALDQHLSGILSSTVDQGADIFNRGNHEGCYRLYQGSLQAILPLLDHRPDMKAKAMTKMRQAAMMHRPADQAWQLRKAIDEIQTALARDLKAAPPVARSLWDRLGGEPAVRAVVHDFVMAAASDPRVNFDRNGMFALDDKAVAQLEQRLVELVSAVGGGPLKYSGRDMKTAHQGMRITDAEFDALAGHLIAVLKKYNVPQKEIDELVGAVASTRKDVVEKK